VAEVVVAVDRNYDGRLLLLSLADFSLLAEHEELASDDVWRNPEIVSVTTVTAADGSAKAVLSTEDEKLQVYDISSQLVDWTSGGLSGGFMINAITLGTENGFELIAATSSELTLWKPNSSGFVKSYTATATCNNLETFSADGVAFIACVEHSSQESTFSVFNTQLVKQAEYTVDFEVTAIESTDSNQLLVASQESVGPSYNINQKLSFLRLFDPFFGTTVWKSAPLVGRVNGMDVVADTDSGKMKIAIATSEAMYIAK